MPPQDDSVTANWQRRIDDAIAKRQTHEKEWQDNLDAYAGTPLTTTPTRDWVNVNKDFAQVEQKKAQLFFQTPTIRLQPAEPLAAGLEDAVQVHEAVLNEKLGRDGVNAKRLVDAVLVDVLAASGIGATKIGYRTVTQKVKAPVPTGEMDPLTGAPITDDQDIDVPIHEEYFWERVSPKKLVVPADWYSTDFEKAPWLGIQFAMPLKMAKAEFDLPEDFARTAGRDERVFEQSGRTGKSGTEDLVTGTELWYRAAFYDDDVTHPEVFRELVLIDGLERPARRRNSPYQTIGPDGRLTPDSLLGNPIHPLTLRDLPDSAYVPSDSQITRAQVNELAKFRTQLLRQRDTNIPLRLYNADDVPPTTIAKIETGDFGSLIGLPREAFLTPQPPIVEIARAQFPRENFTAQDYIEKDINEAQAMGANQRSTSENTQRTATEAQIRQANTDVRLDAERTRVLEWYLRGVAKFDALCQRFADTDRYVRYVGQQGEQRHAIWNKQVIAGRFLYDILPDSQSRVDAAQRRQEVLNLYNLTRQDPFMNPQETGRLLCVAFGMDPQKVMTQPQPPGPPPPNVSVRIDANGIDPRLSNFPILMELLRQGGYQVSPEAVQQAQAQASQAGAIMASVAGKGLDTMPPPNTQHGGAAPKTEPIDKHASELTGGTEGIGTIQ